MMLSGGSDAVYCKMFVSTLQGTAMKWFVSPPNGHITDFQQFSKIFVEQYIVNKAPPRVSYDLFDIRQYQGESLREYLNRRPRMKKCWSMPSRRACSQDHSAMP